MQESQSNGGDGRTETDAGLAVMLAAEHLADAITDAILVASPGLDPDAIRRDTSEMLWRGVARLMREPDGPDENAVLRDAVADMDGWLDRLPVGSGWADAFALAQGSILDALDSRGVE